jgi:hypothetical protein
LGERVDLSIYIDQIEERIEKHPLLVVLFGIFDGLESANAGSEGHGMEQRNESVLPGAVPRRTHGQCHREAAG